MGAMMGEVAEKNEAMAILKTLERSHVPPEPELKSEPKPKTIDQTTSLAEKEKPKPGAPDVMAILRSMFHEVDDIIKNQKDSIIIETAKDLSNLYSVQIRIALAMGKLTGKDAGPDEEDLETIMKELRDGD